MRKSFTLIELIVVIGIIALLSGLGVSSYNGFQQAARDTRRKADLETITNALNAYYSVNGMYPPAGTSCAYGANCYVGSHTGTNWIPALVPTFIEALPQDPTNNVNPSDPINNNTAPWSTTNNNYIYTYGNVFANGQSYDLTARLENTADPDRCGVKNYKFHFSYISWCQQFGGMYSNQIYEFSPNTN